jgi:hypothetical protein
MKMSHVRKLIKEYIILELLSEFDSKDMAKGTSWKVGSKGWAAKNQNGVTNYWYGEDETKNKKATSKFAHNTDRTITK